MKKSVSFDEFGETNCLCPMFTENESQRIAYDFSEFNFFSNLSTFQLNALRQITEIFNETVSMRSVTCRNICSLLDSFQEEDVWNDIVIQMKESVTEKHVLYTFAKLIGSLMYNFSIDVFRSRFKSLLDMLFISTSKDDHKCILECLISIGNFEPRQPHYQYLTVSNCENLVACTVASYKELFCCFNDELSNCWERLKSLLLVPENPNIISFLILWKKLVEKRTCINVGSSVMFTNQVVFDFFDISCKLLPLSFRMYVDIVVQCLDSYIKEYNKNPSFCLQMENFKGTSVKELLEFSSFHTFTNSLCSSSKRLSESEIDLPQELNIVTKKVLLIILYFCSGLENEEKLSQILEDVTGFLKHKMGCLDLSPRLLINSFAEEDDLLFGMMLLTLKIYLKTKSRNCPWFSLNTPICGIFNPHAIFIEFLQSTGNDADHLLSFLMSDETCCLAYLMTFLKLLLCEWDYFIEACLKYNLHSSSATVRQHSLAESTLVSFHNECSASKRQLTPFINSEAESENLSRISPSTVEFCDLAGTSKRGANSEYKTLSLVDYSSSSSSENESEENETETDVGRESKCCAFKILSALTNLRTAIQKLVDVDEFTFNVAPLLSLLKECVKKSELLK